MVEEWEIIEKVNLLLLLLYLDLLQDPLVIRFVQDCEIAIRDTLDRRGSRRIMYQRQLPKCGRVGQLTHLNKPFYLFAELQLLDIAPVLITQFHYRQSIKLKDSVSPFKIGVLPLLRIFRCI